MFEPVRIGYAGAGYVTNIWHIPSLEAVRNVVMSGVFALKGAEEACALGKKLGVGDPVVFTSIAQLCEGSDIVAVNSPNHTRLGVIQQIAAAVAAGAKIKALFCEKPFARNMAEARAIMALAAQIGVPTYYGENQMHMPSVWMAKEQLAAAMAENVMGPPYEVTCSERHPGPHQGWFYDPCRQGGGSLLDMGCHEAGLAWLVLTPPGKPLSVLKPVAVRGHISLQKWGQPFWVEYLKKKFGADAPDYGPDGTPAEDNAEIVVTFRNVETEQLVTARCVSSWQYEQGLLLDCKVIGPGYLFDCTTNRSPLELFLSDMAAEKIAAVADTEAMQEKSLSGRGLMAPHVSAKHLYGYRDQIDEMVRTVLSGSANMLPWSFGLDVLQVLMAGYMSAENGGAEVNLEDAATLAKLETFIPLVQQGRGAELLHRSHVAPAA